MYQAERARHQLQVNSELAHESVALCSGPSPFILKLGKLGPWKNLALPISLLQCISDVRLLMLPVAGKC